MTADHIGPISLGFCHSTNFAPKCKACNSAKNNRLSLSDVRKLLTLEADGNQVVSWHSQYIWDKYKNTITSDKDARKLSSLMLKCHQNVLKLFSFFVNKGETGMTCTVFPALEEQKLWLQTGKGDISIEKLDISEIHL